MSRPAHRQGGGGGISLALLLAILVGFGLGWAGAMLYGSMTSASATSPAVPPAPSPTPTSPPPSAPPPAAAQSSSASEPVHPVGFAQPTGTPSGLEITAVVTKRAGGVVLTVVAQNNGDKPIRVSTTELGPGEVSFRGAPVPRDLAPRIKTLAPGEALVYPCTVRLPDMNVGDLTFTVGGMPFSGRAAGD